MEFVELGYRPITVDVMLKREAEETMKETFKKQAAKAIAKALIAGGYIHTRRWDDLERDCVRMTFWVDGWAKERELP